MDGSDSLALWLLRHAKASREPPPGGGDHERVLAPRGAGDAAQLGAALWAGQLARVERLPLPELVLCSTAARTRQTAEAVLGARPGDPPPVDHRREVYDADPDDMVDLLRSLEGPRSVMVVGHNPTMQDLALELAPPDGRLVGGLRFVTCALAVLTFPVDGWSEVAPGGASSLEIFSPPY